MGNRLEGKVAIITGAARSMGAAQAGLFVAEGAKVVIADILDDDGKRLADQLGDSATFVHLDVGEEAQWEAAVDTAVTEFGSIDILVNNAGVYRRASFEEITPELIDLHYKVNQLGVFLGLRAVYAPMREQGSGSIVNVSSISGMRALPGHAAYGTTKWAVRGLTKYAATEFGRHGIRVNSTHPGFIDTVMLEENSPEVNAGISAVTPLGRKGTVDELAEVTLFLASDASSYVNGAELTIDGGTSI
ncbi:SDR family NAD(P)-dependent oxidoreductase [Paenarthrobacter sp. NPDC090522]|uniref:SDR family NAD(P)-dependent oxidoreductase n=1 Tax=Paenarthrobacter sp. NPDC090522 TaxID=3364383 RepID=UPI003826F2C4